MKRITVTMVLLGLSFPARAIGLRTQFGEDVVKNIKIGQTYSLNSLLHLPLRIVNTGAEDSDLMIETVRISTADMRPNYEPFGALDWVRVAQSTFTVAPNREAEEALVRYQVSKTNGGPS